MTEIKERKKKAIIIWGGAILMGIAASFVMIRLNFYLPCPFRSLTGYLCPGCGATRMFLNLFQLDFIGAFKSNGMLLVSLPFILFILAEMTVSYVNDGKLTNSKTSGRIAVALIACFVAFGILRNLI